MTVSPRKILNERGLAAHKGLGQNFLADPGTARRLLDRAELPSGMFIVEIGPGLGALTAPLLERGFSVAAVEIDRGLSQYLEEELRPQAPDRLTIYSGDILEMDFRELAGGRASFGVVGNLPYQISSPLLFNLLEARENVSIAVLMFQKELADRLVAGPGDRTYGILSVFLNYYARIERLLDIGPEVFFPRPKVGSTVLRLTFKSSLDPAIKDEEIFKQTVRAGFAQRRKTLKNALSARFAPEMVEAALSAAGIKPDKRAETLTSGDFVRLANAFSTLSFGPGQA